MRESRETVFPVPEGISNAQWPCNKENTISALITVLVNIPYNYGHIRDILEIILVKVTTRDKYLGIQGSLELHHICILFRIYVVVWKVYQETIYVEPKL